MNTIIDFINDFSIAGMQMEKPVKAILLFLSSFILAKFFDWCVTKILSRITQKTTNKIDDKIIAILHRPVFYTILFIGLNLSIVILSESEKILFISGGIFKTLTILIWAIAGFQSMLELLKWYSKRADSSKIIRRRTVPLFDNLGKVVIFIFASYFILISWDIDVTAWLASAGILGIVIAFGTKDTLSNLFAGIFIMADAPYKEGDYVNLDTGERGYIRSIGLRSTRIMTRDDIEITVPNSIIANSKIINESGGPSERERIRININIAYGSDIELVKQTLLDISTKDKNVCQSPEPRVRFRSFMDSSLHFQLLCWIDEPAFRGRVMDQLNSDIYAAFKEKGIEFPFPQRTVHISNWQSKPE